MAFAFTPAKTSTRAVTPPSLSYSGTMVTGSMAHCREARSALAWAISPVNTPLGEAISPECTRFSYSSSSEKNSPSSSFEKLRLSAL